MHELVTVVTPTYNRAHLLEKLYNSLCSQIDKRFKWLVIDDGSCDNTEEVVAQFVRQADFEVAYIKKENGGKHTALNIAFQIVDTYLTFIVDSDDVLTKDAIASICEYSDEIKRQNLSGVNFLRGYSNGTVIGDVWPGERFVDNDINVRLNKGITGDKAEVFRTDILRQYQFPVYPEERFIGEHYVWWQIAYDYDMLYVNKVIYLTEYLDGGLTKSGRVLRLKNPLGGMAGAQVAFHPMIPLKIQIRNAILYGIYGFQAKFRCWDIVTSAKAKWLVLLTLVPAKMLQLYWVKKYLGDCNDS